MSTGVVVSDGEELSLELGESVLEGLVRHGRRVSHSCRAGHCQACLVQGDPAPRDAQVGLKATLVEQGYFLACQARPSGRVELHSICGMARSKARVLARDLLAPEVLRLRMERPSGFEFRPGQFVNLRHPSGAIRSYSLANTTTEEFLELHVRRVPEGRMSAWLHDEVAVGEQLSFQGPQGACFYVSGREEQPLLLAGVGTGLAPLWGIARDAIHRGHRGPLHLVQGAFHSERLYLIDELRDLEAMATQVHVHLCALQGSGEGVREVAIDKLVAEIAKELDAPRAFLCGDPPLVRKLQRGLFLAGVASRDILADPFLATPESSSPS